MAHEVGGRRRADQNFNMKTNSTLISRRKMIAAGGTALACWAGFGRGHAAENPPLVTASTFTPAEDLALITEYARKIKPQMCKPANGILRFPYLTAGVKSYPYLIDWDAVWGGMAYLAAGDPEPLRGSLLNLLDHTAPTGKGQRVIKPDSYGAPTFHSRPFLATGSFVLSRETDSVEWMRDGWFERLHANLMYWHAHRTGRHGLLKWWHMDEGFADNGVGNWAWDVNCVEAVDLNAQMILEHSCAAWLAGRLGLADRARDHRRLAASLHLRMEEVLWDEKTGFYFSSFNPRERAVLPTPIRAMSYTNLWPLWLGLAPAARGKRALEYVVSPEHFWSEHGIRSLAKSDSRYNNARQGMTFPMTYPEPSAGQVISSNWQGPIWSLANYQAALALRRYGREAEARRVAERIIRVHAASLRSLGAFAENYSAETGEPLAATGGLGSWCLMLQYLPAHLQSGTPWLLKGLDLPSSDKKSGTGRT